MGFSKDYPEVPDWVEKPEGYKTGDKVKYEGNIFVANFWASKPGEGDPNKNGWRLYDELYDVTASPAAEPARVIGYIPTWRQKEGFDYANKEMYRNVTHGIISFLMFSETNLGEFDPTSVSDVEAIFTDVVLAAHECGTYVSIALGGATDYGFLSLMERIGNNPGDPLLQATVKKVADFVDAHDLDGVDLDLECWWDKNSDPNKDQGGRLKSAGGHAAGKGLTEFAKQLKQAMPGKNISAALFATSWYGNCYDPGLVEHVDWLGIMTYDLTGSWNQTPVGPQTALLKIRDQKVYAEEQQGGWPGNRKASENKSDPASNNPILSVEDALWYWSNPFFTNWQGEGQKLQRNKLAAGVPIYGYDFAYGKDPDDLSGQVAPGYKTIRYKDLLSQFPDAATAANANIKVPGNTPRPPFVADGGSYPYAHNIYFETPDTAVKKLNLLKSVGAQGVIIWELSNDVWEGGKSIVQALYQNSGNPATRPALPSKLQPTPEPNQPPKPKDWTPQKWMEVLDDTKLLSEFTIPGTHETCSLHGGPITKCQRLRVNEQLNAGIRAIDIRCRHFKDRFTIHHGAVYQEVNFTDVLNQCKAFLDSHPKECIVMFVKNECTGQIGSCKDADNTAGRTFEDTFDWYLEQDNTKGYFYLGDRIPRLKDVQKKIVLIRRFPAARGPKGIIPDWGDNTTFSALLPDGGMLRVQDQYNVPTIDVRSKWNRIKSLFEEARKDSTKNTWHINFTSGASLGAYPNAVAGRINHQVSDYVSDKTLTQVRLGTIMTDFPDDKGKTELVDRIIAVNFR